jgi:hypothetical protein
VLVIEIPVRSDVEFLLAETVVEAASAAEGLWVARKAAMATYPGSIHWHLRRGNDPGTIEVTVWPAGRRIWLKVHPLRNTLWVEPAAERLKERLVADFGTLGGAPSSVKPDPLDSVFG